MVKVGDKVTRTPQTIEDMVGRDGNRFGNALTIKPMRGEVIFVHSKGRFHVVEFTNSYGVKLRESFDGVEG